MHDELSFLSDGGEMGALLRAHDWTKTTLGDPALWPQSLKTTLRLLLNTGHPMYVWWGPELLCFYNDAYRQSIGPERHPSSVGQPGRVVWAEIWPIIGTQIDQVMAGGGPTWHENALVPITRNGRLEDVYWTYSYGPIDDPDAPGGVGGVLVVCTETTQQVLTEKRLRESENRLELALSAGAGVGTWDWDIVPDRVFADARFARLYGVDPAMAAAGAPIVNFFQRIHPDDFPALQRAIEDSMRTGGFLSAEYRLVQPDGSALWVLAEGSCYLDAEGRPVRLAGVTFDITERREAADKLRRLNTELEARVIQRTQARGMTWQLSPDLLGALNSEGYFETSNPAWRTVLGWSEEEVAATSIWELLHPDDVERTRGGFALTQIGQPAIRFPNRYRCKDGGYRWISWVGVPEEGLVYCAGRDITDEVAATAERDQIFQITRDLVGAASFDGRLLSINPAWSRALGRPEAELLARPFSEIIHPDDLALTAEVLDTLQGGQVAHQFHVRLLRADGEPISYAWSASPGGPGSGIFYTVGRDITEDIAKATELADAQDALRQSQKMEAVGQLTGGIAHDFNNLLAGISGSLELLEARISQGRLESVSRYIGMAREGAARAATLTQRLLAFARRQTLDPKVIDINRVVAGMSDLLDRAVGPTIHVEVVQGVGLWNTRLDPSQLENAVLNLCINGRDAMAPRGGRITIETANKWMDERAAKERELPPGQYVSLCVSDTGVGMTPEIIEKAFDPFFTTKPLGQGTGLGLSMIYGFVRQSGGQVRIYSELGHGTTMCLYFPRFIGALDAADPAEDQTIDRGDGETVLIIDDEPAIRMLVADVLGDSGYRVLEAEDGPSGLRLLEATGRVDLLITDVGLPGGLNGRQVADAARAARPSLKVLFITGFAENAVVGNGHLEAGMAIITKPFDMTALANKVREIIDL